MSNIRYLQAARVKKLLQRGVVRVLVALPGQQPTYLDLGHWGHPKMGLHFTNEEFYATFNFTRPVLGLTVGVHRLRVPWSAVVRADHLCPPPPNGGSPLAQAA